MGWISVAITKKDRKTFDRQTLLNTKYISAIEDITGGCRFYYGVSKRSVILYDTSSTSDELVTLINANETTVESTELTILGLSYVRRNHLGTEDLLSTSLDISVSVDGLVEAWDINDGSSTSYALFVNGNKRILYKVNDVIANYEVQAFPSADLLLTSVGTGIGVSTLTIASTKDTVITVDGDANFYTNSTGTIGESKTWTVTPGADRTIYLKCTSGTANFIITKSAITKIVWVSKSNAAKLSGDITNLTNITYLDISWSNAITGDITNFKDLTYLAALSTSALSGSITGLTKLTHIIAIGGTLTGSITGMSDLNYISAYQANTFSGDVTGLTKLTYFKNIGTNNTITGDISGLVDLAYLYTNNGCGSLFGSITLLTKLTFIFVGDTTILSGSITNLTSLTYVQINGDNSLTGDLTSLTDLEFLLVLGEDVSISGDVTNLTKLTTLRIEGTTSVTGSVTNLVNLEVLVINNGTNTNTLSGDVTGLTKMIYLELSGDTSVTGDIQYMTDLQVCYTYGTSVLSIPNVTNIPGLLSLRVHDTVTLTSANVNQILADFWANRDAPKLRTERHIWIEGSLSSGAPTGQGIIDKAALQAYRSPNDDPAYDVWNVLTR